MTTSERYYFVAKSRHDAGGADSRAARSPPIAGTAADPLLHSAAYEVPAFRLQRIDRSCGESRKSRTLHTMEGGPQNPAASLAPIRQRRRRAAAPGDGGMSTFT